MITAKPLRNRDLGRLTHPENVYVSASEHHPDIIKTPSDYHQNEEPRKLKSLHGNKRKIIRAIVENEHGVTASRVIYILLEFCKHQGYNSDTMDVNTVSSALKMLIDAGEISRVKINEVYHYFKRY